MSSASYLPAVETTGKQSREGALSPRADPLYAALLSGDGGSMAGAADDCAPADTLDEPLGETIVPWWRARDGASHGRAML